MGELRLSGARRKPRKPLAGSAHYVRGRRKHYDVARQRSFTRWLRELDRQMKKPQTELPL